MIENGDAKYSSEESELWPSVLLLSRRIPDKVDPDLKRGLFQGRVKQTITPYQHNIVQLSPSNWLRYSHSKVRNDPTSYLVNIACG